MMESGTAMGSDRSGTDHRYLPTAEVDTALHTQRRTTRSPSSFDLRLLAGASLLVATFFSAPSSLVFAAPSDGDGEAAAAAAPPPLLLVLLVLLVLLLMVATPPRPADALVGVAVAALALLL
jgi:hypothetical protein